MNPGALESYICPRWLRLAYIPSRMFFLIGLTFRRPILPVLWEMLR